MRCFSIPKSMERWTTSWSSSWNEPGSNSSAMRSLAVSFPSACWRSMRFSPPPSSLCRLRSSSSSRLLMVGSWQLTVGGGQLVCQPPTANCQLQNKVPLRRHLVHRLVQFRLGRLAVAAGLGQARARLLLDGVIGGEVLLERPRDDGDADLGVAEFDEAAVLEPVDDRAREELDLADAAGHRADSSNMSAPHTPAPKGYHSAAPPTARTRPGRSAAA